MVTICKYNNKTTQTKEENSMKELKLWTTTKAQHKVTERTEEPPKPHRKPRPKYKAGKPWEPHNPEC